MDAAGAGALIVGAYLLGAAPSAYLVALWWRGIDIREYGSGNVGGSNAIAQVGRLRGAPVILFDVLIKAPVPVLLASDAVLGYGPGVQAAAGLAAVVGHNWSPFLKFAGGRGIGVGGGAMLALQWQLFVAYVGVAAACWVATRNSPLAWAVSVVALPALAAALGLRPEFLVFAVVFLMVTAAKRVTSNPASAAAVPTGIGAPRLFWNRLLYDRDVRDRDQWVGRKPGE